MHEAHIWEECAQHQVSGEKGDAAASAALMQAGLDLLRAHKVNRDMQHDITLALEACCCDSIPLKRQCPTLLRPQQTI